MIVMKSIKKEGNIVKFDCYIEDNQSQMPDFSMKLNLADNECSVSKKLTYTQMDYAKKALRKIKNVFQQVNSDQDIPEVVKCVWY